MALWKRRTASTSGWPAGRSCDKEHLVDTRPGDSCYGGGQEGIARHRQVANIAVPIDNEHVRGISIVAWPLENGAAKPDWKPGTDTIADIRPDSYLKRGYDERQRKPDDLEAQEGQRPIAIHALENLRIRIPASSCCGICCASSWSASSKASTRSTSCATHRPPSGS